VEYAVQPWIALTADADLPEDAADSVTRAFLEGAEWWREQMGHTFEVAPTVVYRSVHTFKELRKRHGETNSIWFALQRAADKAGFIDNCDSKRAHYMIGLGGEMGGGMVGSENFGCEHILPGKASITGGFAYTLLEENPQHHGFEAQPWFADTRRNAIGALMHELGHMFGDGVSKPLDHTEADRNIMHAWWDWPTVGFTPEQIEQLRGSPFLR
jgi:hypothetical protein